MAVATQRNEVVEGVRVARVIQVMDRSHVMDSRGASKLIAVDATAVARLIVPAKCSLSC